MAKAGRPKLEWSETQWKQVENMASIHCTQEEICGVMNVDHKTLTRLMRDRYDYDFSQFFKRFSAGGKMSIRRAQFKAAVDKGNTAMLIWLGKQYLGQRDIAIDDDQNDNIIKLAYQNKAELKKGIVDGDRQQRAASN